MKKSYESPDINIFNFNSEGIITTSSVRGGLETGKYKSVDDGMNVVDF